MEIGEPRYGAMLPLERHSALWVQDGVTEEKAQTAWFFLAEKVLMQGPWLPDVHCVQFDLVLE